MKLILSWGWLVIVIVMLVIIWKLYLLIKRIDFIGGIQWTYIKITIPDDAEQTPKAMENVFDVLEGMHKGGDLIEMYFDGYLEAWYSCELHFTKGRARYIMVIPTVHQQFVEGVIYGQYPEANIEEVEDYTYRYSYQDIDKKFDVYGSEMVLAVDDIFPIKSYMDYADTLAEEDTYVDPLQALVEAYTNINEGEEYWIQFLIRPIDHKDTAEWVEKAEDEIDKLAGKVVVKKMNLGGQILHSLLSIPTEALKALTQGPTEAAYDSSSSAADFPKVSVTEKEKAEGILRKISKGGYRVKIRVIYIAPMGELSKPNIGRLIGGFKQFNTYHLNSFKPDPDTKTNGPNYFLKQTRRARRKRDIFLFYQWRDFFSYDDGFMMSGEELATIYHFPSKYMRAPAVERAKAGVGAAPANIPIKSP